MAEQKVILFAGIGRLGIPIAKKLTQENNKVYISYREGKDSEEIIQLLKKQKRGRNIIGIPADLSDLQDIKKFIYIPFKKYKKIDALINMASIYPNEERDWKRWENNNSVTDDDWKYYTSNFSFTKNTCQELLKLENNKSKDISIINFSDARSILYLDQNIIDPYKNQGGIINTTTNKIKSIGLNQLKKNNAPKRQFNPYTLAKRDIAYLTLALALKHKGGKIRVNAIAPGPILPPPDKTKSQSNTVIKESILKRWGEIEPITLAINYLINATFITGEVHKVDGGFNLYHKNKIS